MLLFHVCQKTWAYSACVRFPKTIKETNKQSNLDTHTHTHTHVVSAVILIITILNKFFLFRVHNKPHSLQYMQMQSTPGARIAFWLDDTVNIRVPAIWCCFFFSCLVFSVRISNIFFKWEHQQYFDNSGIPAKNLVQQTNNQSAWIELFILFLSSI